MTDILRDEYFVYFPQLKTLLNKLKSFRKDGLYPIVEELSVESSREIRLARSDKASHRDKRFAFLKPTKSAADLGNIFVLKIYGPKIRQKLEENNMNEIIDLPSDFKNNKYPDGYTVVSFTPVRDRYGVTNSYDVSCNGKLGDMNEARIRASSIPNSLNFICGIISIVDNRTDPRVEQVEKIVSQCTELAKAILHSGLIADVQHKDMDDLLKLSQTIEALTKNLKG